MQRLIQRQQRLVIALIAATLLAGLWFWLLHPARVLEKAEIAEVILATNRIQQSLWDTGYRPEDCTAVKTPDPKGLDPKYTCALTGEAARRVLQAVGQGGRSYYVLGGDPASDPVHVLSFRFRDGRYLSLVVRSLEEADRGIFFGYIANGPSIISDQIRWFRYSNPELGQVLRSLRGK